MTPGSPDSSTPQTRLDTWKSIAEHLGRSSRTVQRWHSAYGLPIHHLSGESGSVYAYPDELDDWLRRRGEAESEPASSVSSLEASDANLTHQTFPYPDSTWDASLVSIQARLRSAQLVALASKMWETLSHGNLTAILYRYREAIDLNPGNAAAYAGLALGLVFQGILGVVSPAVAYASAKGALEDAEEIDSEAPLAQCAAAWLKMCLTREWQGARAGLDELLKHEHPFPLSMNGRGLLCIAEGRLKDASNFLLDAARQSPLSSASMALYCWSEYLSCEFSLALHHAAEIRATSQPGPILDAVEALAIIQQDDWEANLDRVEELAAQSTHPDVLRGALGYAYTMKGQDQRARELLAAMTNPAKRTMCHEPFAIALIRVGLNERQQAIECLEQSYRNGSLWSLGFRSDPILESLRSDPNYQLFMKRASYPDPDLSDSPLAFTG